MPYPLLPREGSFNRGEDELWLMPLNLVEWRDNASARPGLPGLIL